MMTVLRYAHTHTHTHTHTQAHSLAHSYTQAHSLTHSYTQAHSLTHSHSHTLLGACLDSPCGDNGTCYNHAAGGYECVCRPGSYGVNCNIPSNQLCTGSDVQNCYGNGICSIINKAHGPEAHCTCYPEFDDSSRCRWRAVYDVCFSERPCENGGVCNYVFGGDYQCECPFSKCKRSVHEREREREREKERGGEGGGRERVCVNE